MLQNFLEEFKKISGVFIDAYFIVDNELNIIDFNPPFYALFPKSIARQLKKKKYIEVIHLNVGENKDIIDECIQRKQAVRYDEIIGMIPEHREMRLIASAIPFSKTDGGDVESVLILLRDVTDEAMMQNKYKQMLEVEAAEKAKLELSIQEKLRQILNTNEDLNRVQKELSEYKKGLRVF
jgi:PAS domain-containing protein